MKVGPVLLGLAVALAGCVSSPPEPLAGSAPLCRTESAAIRTDFAGAPAMRCVVEGEHAFALLVTPEHAPPINDSPWYAFRYENAGPAPLSVRLDYLGGEHRYRPKRIADGTATPIAAQVAENDRSASISLPGRSGLVAAQEMVGIAENEALLDRLAALPDTERLTLGASRDGHPLEAVRIGDRDAPRLIVLLGRAHPPEVTGALAMRAFLETLFAQRAELQRDFQILALPMLNPDGVMRGHWRANRGGVDLNRDWGAFSQPETRAVHNWLAALPDGVRPVLMIDFHSTYENLFYVQGEEATEAQEAFRDRWLGGKQQALPGFSFRIEPRNANPGSGTAKNWFHGRYGIPAYTYEVADEADRESLARAAEILAADLIAALRATTE